MTGQATPRKTASCQRIAIGGILTECNHLGGVPINMDVYESSELRRDQEVLQATTSVLGGMLATMRKLEMQPVPLLFASACAGGPVVRSCYGQLREEWFQRLKQACPVDGVLLPLHGSALVEGLDDPEGDMIQAARDLVGPNVPIIVTLDLHAHVTPQMVANADALIAWETYPHRDQFETGARAVRLLAQMLTSGCRPVMAMSKVPVITSAIHGSTDGDDPFADLMRLTKSFEERAGVLSTSLFLVHPYMDCEGMGSGGLVVTDNDLNTAVELSQEIASRYWDRRFDLEPTTVSPQLAIAKGLELRGGPVILVETADCCGGGAAGDSVACLSVLVDAEIDVPSIVSVVDPEAAAACHAAGVGATVTLDIGHKLDPRWGLPRSFKGTVKRLTDGQFTYRGGQWHGDLASMGPTAVFRIGSIDVILTSRATYDWADEQLLSVGLKPHRAKFIVAKNPMNYRVAFGSIAKAVFVVDTPGPTPPTLKHVQFKKLRSPYFPADSQIIGLRPVVLTSRS